GGDGSDFVSRYYDTLMEELLALPGIEAAGAAQALPISPVTNDFTRPYRPPGSSTSSAEAPTVNMRMTTAGYFDAVGMRFLSGGPFTGLEVAGGPRVAVVNQTLATRLWPQQDAVGESLEVDFRDGWQSYRVVGVVEDVLHQGARSAPTDEVFLPHVQIPYLAMSVVLRTSVPPESLVPSVRQTVLDHPPGQPPHNFVGFEQMVATSMALERFLALLLAVFAGISLSLAAIGVYGVVAYAVTMRTRELGIRLALGAHADAVVREIVVSASKTAAVGLVLGAALAFLLGRGLESLLFEVAPTDPRTFLIVSIGLLLVAALAAFLSASRVTRVDPLMALRQE
ncbi:MAG: ABC transporter permease, partial [Longimicrobiales bacterium]